MRLAYIDRVNKSPSVPLPIGCRSYGERTADPGWRELFPPRGFVEVYWCRSGVGEFQIGGRPHLLTPGHSCVYRAWDEQIVSCRTAPWAYSWITFDGPLCNELVEAFGIPREPRKTGPRPEPLIQQIRALLKEVTPYAEYRASAVVYDVLVTLAPRRTRPAPEDILVNACIERIDARLGDPDLTVARLAQELATHRSSLSRLFGAKMSMSPQQYLISVRMRKAMALIRETGMTGKEIARACGYADPDYFSRAFKKMTGRPPMSFRGE